MGNTVSFKKEFGLILVGAIIFTASFLWKDFLSDVEERYFPKEQGLGKRLVFVIAVTIILIALAVHLKGFFGISSNKNSIQFDDSPIDDEDDYNSIGDYIGADHLDLDHFKLVYKTKEQK